MRFNSWLRKTQHMLCKDKTSFITMRICDLYWIIGLQGLWKRQGQITLHESRAEETCFKKMSLFALFSCLLAALASACSPDSATEEENVSPVCRDGGTACHNLLCDEPLWHSQSQHSQFSSGTLHSRLLGHFEGAKKTKPTQTYCWRKEERNDFLQTLPQSWWCLCLPQAPSSCLLKYEKKKKKRRGRLVSIL